MGRGDRRTNDHYARAAHRRGYPARSVFKLEQIDRKHRLFHTGMRVLDLGAAPGSWSRYVAERAGPGGLVLAVDLKDLEIPRGAERAAPIESLTGDFTEREIRARIDAAAPFDAVISDAAPATTGNRVVDTARSEALVEAVFASLDGWLRPGGSLVCKLFQGGGERAILAAARRTFAHATLVRPDAVRRESFEAYVVCSGFAKKEAAPMPARPSS